MRDIRNLFEPEEDYYKPERVLNIWSNNHIKCESTGRRNKILWVEEYLNTITPFVILQML